MQTYCPQLHQIPARPATSAPCLDAGYGIDSNQLLGTGFGRINSLIAAAFALFGPERGVRKKKESQADRMLDAASRLFGGCPFHEVRMEDIAAEANVGKGTIYRYFASKDELYLKLVERAAKEYRVVIRTAADPHKSCINRLVAITQMNIDFFKSQPRLLDLIQRAEVDRGRGPEFPWHEARLEFYTLVTELFREGMNKGEFVITDPHLVALLLGGGIRAFLLHGSIQCSTDLAEKAVGSLIGKVCHNRSEGHKLKHSNPN